jgi:hypothetical protein
MKKRCTCRCFYRRRSFGLESEVLLYVCKILYYKFGFTFINWLWEYLGCYLFFISKKGLIWAKMEKKLVLYWNLGSQPARAVKALLDIGKIPCELVTKDVIKEETRSK